MIQNIFSEELIQALGWTMIHSLWQGFAVAILMGLAMIVLQKPVNRTGWKSAKVRYEIAWFALFLVFVLSLSTFIYLYDSVSGGEILGGTITTITDAGITVESAEIVQSFFQKTIQYFNEHLPLIVTLWMMGMVFFFLRLLGGIAYVERLKHQKQNQLPEAWQQVFEKLVARFPMKKTVRFAESSLAKVPMVIGYFKPIILFPVGAVNRLSIQEVEAVLAHELAHIYRNDYLLNIIQSIIEIIFYYHPAVWWISANIRTERENCCDDIAVQLCGNSLTYVKALVNLEEIHSAPSLAMSFSSGSKNQLLNRVKRILNQPQNKFNIMEKFTATCFLLGVLLLFSVSATEPVEDETSNDQEIVTTDLQNELENKNTWINDTVPAPPTPPAPKMEGDGKFMFSDGKEKVEVKYEDDEIISLKINGERIPKEEYADYEEHVKELMESVPAPPSPPRMGGDFIVPPAPPVPPQLSFGSDEGLTITKFENKNNKVIITQDEDGNTIIISDSNEEGENTHVVIGDGELSLNGRVIQLDELPLVFGDEDLKVDFPDIKFITGDGIQIRSFDSEELRIPSLAEIPEFLDTFDIEGLAEIMDDFPEFEMPEMPEMPEMNFDNNFNFDTIPHGNIWIDSNEVDWDDLSEEEKEEYRNKLKEAEQHLKEARIFMKEQMEEQIKELKTFNQEQLKTLLKESEGQKNITVMEDELAIKERIVKKLEEKKQESQGEKKRLIEALQNKQREQMAVMREQHQERMQEMREIHQEKREEIRERQMERRAERTAERSKWVSDIEAQLRGDGHIKSNGSFKFVLTEDELKINGKTQSNADWKKYKELYEMASSNSLTSDFKIKISKDRNNNQKVSVSISDNSH